MPSDVSATSGTSAPARSRRRPSRRRPRTARAGRSRGPRGCGGPVCCATTTTRTLPGFSRKAPQMGGLDGVDTPHPMGSPSLTESKTTHSLTVMPTAAFAGDPLAPVFTYADGPDDAALALLVVSPLASEAVGSRRALVQLVRALAARGHGARADRSARHRGERGRSRGRHVRGALRRPAPRSGRARAAASRPPGGTC